MEMMPAAIAMAVGLLAGRVAVLAVRWAEARYGFRYPPLDSHTDDGFLIQLIGSMLMFSFTYAVMSTMNHFS